MINIVVEIALGSNWYIWGVGKLIQRKCHWEKIKNTSELQNQFVVSNTVLY